MACEYRAFGRVQGVGYRWFVRETAHAIDVSGWVRNEPDGSVCVVAAGSTEQLEHLERALRCGPPGADVQRLVVRHADEHDDLMASPEAGAPNAHTKPFAVVRSGSRT
ncbi:MAG: acylphosphatase [Gemmatimonas sp.]